MKKFLWTLHSLGHIIFPELDANGNVVMVPPAPEAVAAANNYNMEAQRKYTTAVARWKRGQPTPIKPSLKPVPRAQPKVGRELLMGFGRVYDLPEDNPDVKMKVELGYLKPVAEEASQAPVAASPAPSASPAPAPTPSSSSPSVAERVIAQAAANASIPSKQVNNPTGPDPMS